MFGVSQNKFYVKEADFRHTLGLTIILGWHLPCPNQECLYFCVPLAWSVQWWNLHWERSGALLY